MYTQSQINKIIHDWILTLTGLSGANIRPQRRKFGFNLVDATGKPLAFDETICMFYVGLQDDIVDKQFIDFDNVSMLKNASVSITFIGEGADIYATTLQSLAYGVTSRNYLKQHGFALSGDITSSINDREYSEKWFYRRTLNATFNIVVNFTPQNVPSSFDIEKIPINVQGLSSEVTGDLQYETVTITPTQNEQIIYPSAGKIINQIIVNPVTNLIDDNIRPENIALGVEILGVTGTANVYSVNQIIRSWDVFYAQVLGGTITEDDYSDANIDEMTNKLEYLCIGG